MDTGGGQDGVATFCLAIQMLKIGQCYHVCEDCEGHEDLAWDAPKVFGENRLTSRCLALNPICLSWDMDVRLGPFGVGSRRTVGNVTVSV